jgi:hypothetical protein
MLKEFFSHFIYPNKKVQTFQKTRASFLMMTDYLPSWGRMDEYQTRRCHIPDDSRVHNHCRDSLKPREYYHVWVWRTNITECPECGMNSVFPCQKNIFNVIYVSRTVHCYKIVWYKQKNSSLWKFYFNFYVVFFMFRTQRFIFRQRVVLYVQEWYSVFCCMYRCGIVCFVVLTGVV